MTRPLALAALLALAAAGTLDVFGPDGQRVGLVREGPAVIPHVNRYSRGQHHRKS